MRLLQSLVLPVVAIASIRSAAVANAQHAHGAHAAETTETTTPTLWESSSIYELSRQSYALEFCTSSEELLSAADGGMIYAFLPIASDNEAAIANVTTHASELRTTFSSTKVVHQSITNGTLMQVANSSVEVLYRVEFAEDEEAHEEGHEEEAHVAGETHCVTARVQVPAAGKYMLFAEHASEEVVVRVLDGSSKSFQQVDVFQCVTDCEAEAEATASAKSQSWAAPILASLLISITSLLGVFILSFDKGRVEVIVEYMSSFAAGCLLGVVVFHLYPEGSEYLADLGEWVMGASVLGGIAFSMALEQGVHLLLASFGADPCTSHAHAHHAETGHSHGDHHHHRATSLLLADEGDKETNANQSDLSRTSRHSHASHHIAMEIADSAHPFSAHEPHTPRTGTSASDGPLDSPLKPKTFRQKYISSLLHVQPVAWITAIGDFFHAFTDGVVLAVAFKSCSSSLGWAVMLGIVLHEVPHRVGDFFIFLKAGMLVAQALAINLFASLASFFGVIILLAAGAVSDHTLGFLLAFGTGALLFIAMSELLPPMLQVRDRQSVVIHFVWFALGCVAIGLSKLQDVHCDATTGQEISH